MTAIEKFTFALSFDDADNVIRSAGDDDEHYELGKKKKKKKDDTPPPPPAIYTEEQASQMVAEAETKAHEQGFSEGHRQGFEQAHQEIMASLEKAVGDVESEIAVKLDQIDEQQKRANAKINEDAIHVALGIIRKLAPAWSKQYQLTEIEDIVRQCLANLFDVPKVMIKVHPDLEKEVSAAAERIAVSRGFSGKVVVVGEPDVAVGDCQVSWGDGTAVRDSARVWSEINAIIDNALDMHAGEHGLQQSDMGDENVQESRLPSDAPPASAQPAATSEQPASELPDQAVHQPNAAQQASANTQDPGMRQDAQQEAPVHTPVTGPDLDVEQVEQVNAVQAPEGATSQVPPKPQEGDGTIERNVQTSINDAMMAAGETSEHSIPQDLSSSNSAQAAPEPQADVKNVGEADTTSETKTTHVADGQPNEADEMAAVKQPTKDAGDENG